MTIQEKYELFIREVHGGVQQGDVHKQTFYAGAVSAIEIISKDGFNMKLVKERSIDICSEVVGWALDCSGMLLAFTRGGVR
jgi:hypothetical protein